MALPRNGSLVIGRSRCCELTLKSLDASRRHAEIISVSGGYRIRDLGSTNGTIVNGNNVDERTLKTGDRIEIGGEFITFCELDQALDSPEPDDGEAKTILVERPALGECIRGDLAEIPPFAVLQMLEMGNKSGVLELDSDGEPARLWLLEGRPVHAETKDQHGFDAAIAMVGADKGRFSFEPNRAAPKRTIDASITELLLEALRRLDEAS